MIDKEIEKIFPNSKLKNDFFTWLSKEHLDPKNVTINEIDNYENTRTVSFIPNDPIHMYKVIVEYDKYQGMWYAVYIAIGHFTQPDEHGLMKVEKAVAKLFYNSDLSLYRTDLFFDSMND